MEQKCANCANGKWHDGVTAITDICIECKYVDKGGEPQPSNWKPKVSSNADRIRAMSDEELAVWVTSIRLDTINEMCKRFDVEIEMPTPTIENTADVCEWLKQPAEGK